MYATYCKSDKYMFTIYTLEYYFLDAISCLSLFILLFRVLAFSGGQGVKTLAPLGHNILYDDKWDAWEQNQTDLVITEIEWSSS